MIPTNLVLCTTNVPITYLRAPKPHLLAAPLIDIDVAVAKILVVDDEISIRELLQQALTADQHSVLVAQDGVEALEILRANAVDLAIVDLILPRMHGLELLRQMRDEFAHVKVIVMSAYEDIVDLAQRQKEVVAFLKKPFTLTELADVLQPILGDG